MKKIKVRWVIILENKIFLLREIKKHFYYLPWWTLEEWETIRECLKRELFEELWVKAEIWELISMREFKNSDDIMLDFWFNINNPIDFIKIDKNIATHSFEYYDEWFYNFDEIHNLDVKPNNIEQIIKDKNKNSIWNMVIL